MSRQAPAAASVSGARAAIGERSLASDSARSSRYSVLSPAPVRPHDVRWPAASQFLECRDLRKTFGELTAVDGVSFHIAPGETYGLLGPNGAGKTTTISMAVGLARRDGGDVLVEGEPLDPGSVELKGRIGLVPQEVAIYPDLTARENLRFFGPALRHAARRAEPPHRRCPANHRAGGSRGRAHGSVSRAA